MCERPTVPAVYRQEDMVTGEVIAVMPWQSVDDADIEVCWTE